MQKIYINKITDMVEQILPVITMDELPDDYFNTCYAVLDKEDKINAYNLKYNKETKEFEVVKELSAFDEVVVEKRFTTEEFNNLKKENEELKDRLDKLESMFTKVLALNER